MKENFWPTIQRALDGGAHALLLVGRDRDTSAVAGEVGLLASSQRPANIVQGDGRTLKIDDVRAWKEMASLAPDAGRRIFVLQRADLLRPISANGLLRLIEEPPPHVTFLLTAVGSTGVMPTIRSRCLTVVVPSSEPDEADPRNDLSILKAEHGRGADWPVRVAAAMEGEAAAFVADLLRGIAARMAEAAMPDAFSRVEKAQTQLQANGSRRLVLEVLLMDLEDLGFLSAW